MITNNSTAETARRLLLMDEMQLANSTYGIRETLTELIDLLAAAEARLAGREQDLSEILGDVGNRRGWGWLLAVLTARERFRISGESELAACRLRESAIRQHAENVQRQIRQWLGRLPVGAAQFIEYELSLAVLGDETGTDKAAPLADSRVSGVVGE